MSGRRRRCYTALSHTHATQFNFNFHSYRLATLPQLNLIDPWPGSTTVATARTRSVAQKTSSPHHLHPAPAPLDSRTLAAVIQLVSLLLRLQSGWAWAVESCKGKNHRRGHGAWALRRVFGAWQAFILWGGWGQSSLWMNRTLRFLHRMSLIGDISQTKTF